MTAPVLSRAVLEELQHDLSAEDIQRGLNRLSEFVALEGEALMSSEAKAKWSAIGARADEGRGTLIERRDGVTLLVVPFTKAVQMAATVRGGRTMGDILRSFPGVNEREAPLVNARGGRVWSPLLPELAPAKKSPS
jgi:hypothetical protein